jgi:hypothetical protein
VKIWQVSRRRAALNAWKYVSTNSTILVFFFTGLGTIKLLAQNIDLTAIALVPTFNGSIN